MSQLDLSYYLRNVLEMTGCFNSACSAIIREKWMLFAYFYYAQFSFMKTLSKILCKWKQDSAVSLFLYLDSVFKNKHKLIHNQAPVMNRLCPFLLNLHK